MNANAARIETAKVRKIAAVGTCCQEEVRRIGKVSIAAAKEREIEKSIAWIWVNVFFLIIAESEPTNADIIA
jgi:hypothetical protein